MDNFGYVFKSMREELGLTQKAFGELIGISTQFVSNIERGKSLAPIKTLKKLDKAIGAGNAKILKLSYVIHVSQEAYDKAFKKVFPRGKQ